MKDNELIEILKEFDEKRVEQLNYNARNLFNAIMDIANERDRLLEENQQLKADYGNKAQVERDLLLEEKQDLINYLKEKINICNDIIKYHTKAINEVVNISDNNRHIILIKRFTIEKQVYEEILSKIEKR